MRQRPTIRTYAFTALIAMAALPTGVSAQGTEVEPNDPCAGAQVFGDTGLPYEVTGNLEANDVDFFRFRAAAEEAIVADLEGFATDQGTLGDPFLGLFDSACNLLATNDDGSGTLNSRLFFAVPQDGVFVLAASGCCDGSFDGSHGQEGTYTLTIAEAPEPGTVSGRVIDAALGDPLPDAGVDLLECQDPDCTFYNYLSYQTTDSLGAFRFDATYWGAPLLPGTYRVTAYKYPNFQTGYSDVFDLLEGEDLDIGDIALVGPPVRFTDIVPCASVPAVGGKCEYSARITNAEPNALRGAAWSLVHASGTGSSVGYTDFPAERLQRLWLRPGESTVVTFKFEVPGTVPQGTYICPRAWVGLGLRAPYFFTVGLQDPLFCISRGATSFAVVTGDEAENIARQLGAQRTTNHHKSLK